MLSTNGGFAKVALAILLFPTFFQAGFLRFAWGAGDPIGLLALKRVLLLLPVCAVIAACWATVLCVVSVPVRQSRREFVAALFLTWWDMARAIAAFWGGLANLVVVTAATAASVLRVSASAVWSISSDLVMAPVRALQLIARRVTSSNVPWIAVSLTLAWCLIETTIFTYVMSPLVVDTFSNITGHNLSSAIVRFPLFTFLLFIVLGSYAVLATFVDAARTRSVSRVASIAVIEAVVLFVEVVFLYREFVDSLVPWFAQYSADFELGIFGTMAIACLAWMGIRSLSWLLFAAHGTPTIMAVIQGRRVRAAGRGRTATIRFFPASAELFDRIRGEEAFLRTKGEALLAAIVLPPLQVVAASLNFGALALLAGHLFTLPFETLASLRETEHRVRALLQGARRASGDARAPSAGDRSPSRSIEDGPVSKAPPGFDEPIVRNMPARAR